MTMATMRTSITTHHSPAATLNKTDEIMNWKRKKKKSGENWNVFQSDFLSWMNARHWQCAVYAAVVAAAAAILLFHSNGFRHLIIKNFLYFSIHLCFFPFFSITQHSSFTDLRLDKSPIIIRSWQCFQTADWYLGLLGCCCCYCRTMHNCILQSTFSILFHLCLLFISHKLHKCINRNMDRHKINENNDNRREDWQRRERKEKPLKLLHWIYDDNSKNLLCILQGNGRSAGPCIWHTLYNWIGNEVYVRPIKNMLTLGSCLRRTNVLNQAAARSPRQTSYFISIFFSNLCNSALCHRSDFFFFTISVGSKRRRMVDRRLHFR